MCVYFKAVHRFAILSSIICSGICSSDEVIFVRRGVDMNNKPTIASSMALSTDVNVLECSLQCLREARCAGILYNSTTRTCRYFEHDVTPTTYSGDSSYFGGLRLKAKSCAEVKSKFKVTADDDYWLYPVVFAGKPVKMYCHLMETASPEEYITLPNYNGGFRPGVYRPSCGSETPTGFGEGVYQFLKIRVTLSPFAMTVDKSDVTFAPMVGDLTESYTYGHADDAYSRHVGGVRGSCGPKGNFTIDTAGTGLIIDPTTTWNLFGTDAWKQVNRSTDGTKVDILCGGFAGSCQPNGPLTLVVNPSDVPPWTLMTSGEIGSGRQAWVIYHDTHLTGIGIVGTEVSSCID